MRPSRCAALALAALLAVSAPAVLAEDGPGAAPGAKKEPSKEGKDAKEGGKDDGVQSSAVTRLERAKRLVAELETHLTILRAQKAEPELIAAVERALADARALAKPVTADELSAEEKKKLVEELKKELGGDEKQPPKESPFDDWRKRAMDAAFKDAELDEAEEGAATKIISDWFQKSEAARMSRDSKAMSDLKRDRDDALEKAIGRKKAQKVINNLNGMGGWKR